MRYFLFFVLPFLSLRNFAQQSDHDAEIMQIKGKWTKRSDVNQQEDPLATKNQSSYELKKIEAIYNLVKETYPNPAGNEPAWYGSINLNPLFPGAPAAYAFGSLYPSYYYNIHLQKISLGEETGSWVEIYVNSLGGFLAREAKWKMFNGDRDWMIDGQPTEIFHLLENDGQWNGIPIYKVPYLGINRYVDRFIMMPSNNKLPYIPITQKQYLLSVKDAWISLKNESNNAPGDYEKAQLKNIEDIKNNSRLDAALKEKIIDDIKKDIDKSRSIKNTTVQKTNDYWNNKIAVIDQYLSTHSELDLEQPAAVVTPGDFIGHFGSDGKHFVCRLVRINPSYFDSHLPRYIPQLIVMHWTADKSTPAVAFTKQFEASFPIAKLQSILNDVKDDLKNEPLVKAPDMKAIRKRAEAYADSILKKKAISFIPPFPAVVPKDTSSGYKIPPRNGAMLATIPEKNLNISELKTYLEKIDQKYTSLLLSQGNKLPDISSLNALSTSYASTLYLLQGVNNQAAWCAIKAVEKDPEDVVVLNNAAAVLNACGFQPVAVTVLQTALDKSPGNATIQNNIGQSYLALGDINKASSYLQQCLDGSPYHPHANFAMACIEYSKGNNSNALNYVQKSLRVSFTDGAMHLFYKLNPPGRLWDVLKQNYKATDYFNEDKYHLPPQCENVNDVGLLKAEYKGYREMVERVKKNFDEIRKTENKLGEQSLISQTKNYQNSSLRFSAFNELGTMMVNEITLRLADEQERLARVQNIYKKEIHDLYEEYNDAYSHAESCAEKLALANKYMEAMAAVTTEYQKTWLPVYREYSNDYAFWGRVQSPDKHFRRAAFAAAASGYLGELLRLAETHFLNLCDPETDNKKEAEDYVIKEPDCGIDVGMNLGIGSFRIDCEKMEYHFGGMLVADVVHTYRTHSTTIAIGAGLDLKFGGEKLKAGPIQGGFGATGKMQYFLTFDGTRPSDQGFIWQGAIEYEQTFNTGLESTIKKIDEVKTNSVDVSAKTVLSVHNGFTSSGSLYEQLDKILEVKPEKPVNRNVKIFNSQK